MLPVIDAFFPEEPTKAERPWLAMPIAQPTAEALEGSAPS
jgi:hypothetical protein